MINTILLMMLVLVVSVIAHEFGHLITMRGYLNKWCLVKLEGGRVRIGSVADYEILSGPQLISVYMNGIYFGAIIIITGAVFKPIFIILLVPYLMGCKKDIKNILNVKNRSPKPDKK